MVDECICGNHIDHLRRLIHIHSVIYYHLNTTIVSDYQFDEWSKELVELQRKFPESRDVGYEAVLFSDWTGDTGYHLPITDYVTQVAHLLLSKYGSS